MTIKYASDTSLSSVGFEKLDIKFFSADTVMNVSGLSQPLVLQFNFDVSKSGALLGSAVECKYYEEATGGWSSAGCQLASIDYENGTVYCECTHTTLFSVSSGSSVKEGSSGAVRVEQAGWTWSIVLAAFFLGGLIFERPRLQ